MGHLPFWSFLILVIFQFGSLPFWSSSILIVFHFGLLPFWLSSILVVFHFGRLPSWSSSILVVFHFGHLLFWSSSILVVFHFGRLPFWLSSILPFWSKSDTFLYPCFATFVGCCFNLELLLTTLPHSSTVVPSRTAQQSYPPAQINGPILPHSSPC